MERTGALVESRDAEFLNRVVNDPSVFPWVSLGKVGPLNLTEVVSDPANLFLRNEWGGFLFIGKGMGVYEIHTQFLPEGRGRKAINAAREAMTYMFTATPCTMLVTHCPLDNKPATFLATCVGMRKVGKAYPQGKDSDMYMITRGEWECQSAI